MNKCFIEMKERPCCFLMVTISLTAVCVISLTGCSKDVATLDKAEREQPAMRKASSIADSGNSVMAIDLYYKALEKNPSWAKAHLELAILFHDIDQINAIYHYKKYLQMRPGTEKKKMIEGRIRAAELLLASYLNAKFKSEKLVGPDKKVEPIIYHVKGGDTLSDIAGKVYNDREKWKIIYDANKETLAGKKSLTVGQSLVMPQIDDTSASTK